VDQPFLLDGIQAIAKARPAEPVPRGVFYEGSRISDHEAERELFANGEGNH